MTKMGKSQQQHTQSQDMTQSLRGQQSLQGSFYPSTPRGGRGDRSFWRPASNKAHNFRSCNVSSMEKAKATQLKPTKSP